MIEPIESNGIPLATVLDMPFMGTSNYEYYGGEIPRIFSLVSAGRHDEAMDAYWRLHPARRANTQAMSHLAGSNFLHRMLWKYQGWLNGWNGGPLRAPTMRLNDGRVVVTTPVMDCGSSTPKRSAILVAGSREAR